MFTWSVFWASWEIDTSAELTEKPQTLKQMQWDIKTLEKEKERLEFKWKTFRIGNDNLWDLIRSDISEAEVNALELLVNIYNSRKNNINLTLDSAVESWIETESIKKELLLLKQELYKDLLPYIQMEKLSEFKVYVESDLALNEKSKEVATEIEEKQSERDERIEEIKEKIEDNTETLRAQIEEKIIKKLQTRLDEFIAQEKFQELPNESKILLFKRLILKLEVKKQSLSDTLNPTSIIEERIILYDIVQDVLQGYIDNWKE